MVKPPASGAPTRSNSVDARLRGHMPVLDGIRGLAISMVLLLHFVGDAEPTNRFEQVICRVANFGALGVDLFFVLSGFLITGILLDAKGRPGYFRSFYMRRSLRIFPLYYSVLFVTFFIAPRISWFWGPDLAAAKANQAWAWPYAINILESVRGVYSMPYLDHFWSLAVEEHFYFVWPLVVWLCPRKTLVLVSLLVALAALGARATCEELHVAPLALYTLTPFRLDSLCIGGFLAAYARRPDELEGAKGTPEARAHASGLEALAQRANLIGLAAIATLVGTYLFNRFGTRALWEILHQVRASTFSVIFGALVVRAVTAVPGTAFYRAFGSAALRWLGKYSYGLYVFHHFLAYYFIRHKTEFVVASWVGSHTLAVLLQASVGTALSMVVAYASFHLFESRVLALKRFWPAGGEKATHA
jgi:peptidoglycan/LPS O-acetylase OafA/YrhL